MTDNKPWHCQTCDLQHHGDFVCCPFTGEKRPEEPAIDAMFAPPPGWEDRAEEWSALVMECDGLTVEQLRLLGLVRIDHIPEGEPGLAALSPEFRTFAMEMREQEPTGHMRALPLNQGGDIDWQFAGPLMNMQLPIVRFVLHYCLGDVPGKEDIIRRMINEWFGQEADLGIGTDTEAV